MIYREQALRGQCHVQRIEHHFGERSGHRRAENAAVEGTKHDREIKKARPGLNIADVGNPQPIRLSRSEIAIDQIRCLAAAMPDRSGDE